MLTVHAKVNIDDCYKPSKNKLKKNDRYQGVEAAYKKVRESKAHKKFTNLHIVSIKSKLKFKLFPLQHRKQIKFSKIQRNNKERGKFQRKKHCTRC